jgi:hypothetical protein
MAVADDERAVRLLGREPVDLRVRRQVKRFDAVRSRLEPYLTVGRRPARALRKQGWRRTRRSQLRGRAAFVLPGGASRYWSRRALLPILPYAGARKSDAGFPIVFPEPV